MFAMLLNGAQEDLNMTLNIRFQVHSKLDMF